MVLYYIYRRYCCQFTFGLSVDAVSFIPSLTLTRWVEKSNAAFRYFSLTPPPLVLLLARRIHHFTGLAVLIISTHTK